jgi:hypothetical protein
MAVTAQDGTRHHSASRAYHHDQMAAQKGEAKGGMKAGGDMDGADGGSKDMSHMEIHEVVAKHGPAHKINITHDHAAAKHEVMSHHKGAHHKSSHMSAEDAHEHAGKAAGLEDESEEHEYDGGEGESPDDAAMKESGSIPGLS